MSLYAQQRKNIAKTWMIMLIFMGIVVGLGYVVSNVLETPVILPIAIGVALITNLASYWWSHKIVLKMSGAKPATREQHFDFFTVAENLSIAAGLPTPALYVVDDPAPNAFATGRNKKHAVVAVTTGLLEALDRTELEGVVAHELAHIKNKDMLVSTIAVVLVGFITMVSDLFFRMTMFGGGRQSSSEGRQGNAIVFIIGLVLAILTPIIGTLLRMAISRKREYLADASGAIMTRYPEGLARALEKITSYGHKMKRANHATAHLFISNPFGAKKAATYINRLFMTHPPAEKRIAILRKMDQQQYM